MTGYLPFLLLALIGPSISMPALPDSRTSLYRAVRAAPAVPYPDKAVPAHAVAPVTDAVIKAYFNTVDKQIDVVAANSTAGNLIPKIYKRTFTGNPEESGPYYQGDIILPARKNGVRRASERWPNGIIPYAISPDFSESDLKIFRQAFEDYHTYTCIRFIPRTNQADYITITNNGAGCFSGVGFYHDGVQQVNIQSPGCNSKATIIHELMHTVGFWHEQNRGDRDDFITIHPENVEEGRLFNFDNKGAVTTVFGVGYDYDSVMHYSSEAFSANGLPTITPKLPLNGAVLGQRRGFANSDVARINRMYGCLKHYQG